MTAKPTISTLRWVPEFARGHVREIRARWAFEEVGQPYDVELIDFEQVKSEAHRRRQPFGQVPTYSDGEVELFESGAIVLRIAERGGGGLLPSDPAARARATQWLIAALNSIEPWIANYITLKVFEADKPWSAMRHDSVLSALEGRLADLEAALADRTWLDGDSFTVGDLVMISVLGILRRRDVLSRFPRLAAYVARGEARPAHEKAMAAHLAVFEHVDAA